MMWPHEVRTYNIYDVALCAGNNTNSTKTAGVGGRRSSYTLAPVSMTEQLANGCYLCRVLSVGPRKGQRPKERKGVERRAYLKRHIGTSHNNKQTYLRQVLGSNPDERKFFLKFVPGKVESDTLR